MRPQPLFSDRRQAGQLLAAKLTSTPMVEPIVYALPRGGVPVAFEIAQALGAPLDLILVRKIGAPGHPELAVGAVVDGEKPHLVINRDVRAMTGADDAFIADASKRELAEIERRRALYARPGVRPDPRGRTAIVVDDGLATGATAKVAIDALRERGAARIILAVPVAPPSAAAEMRRCVDEMVCVAEPEQFWGVGGFYGDFHQLSDDEVMDYLHASRAVA